MAVKTPEKKAAYDKLKERSRERNAEASRAGRDIGELPAVANPKRRKKAEHSFRIFCETYFPTSFSLAWSKDHLKVIAKIEAAVLKGRLFAVAMPRGSGKSTLAEAAALYALLYGHRLFVVLLGSDARSAEQMLDSIKTELETNELLAADFPEVCFPIEQLEGISNRCAGQTYKGERTCISWTKREVVLPTIAGSKASGGILRVAGLLGRIRGMKFKTQDGEARRPDLVIPDDPQTDASANSVSQCERRERILAGAVLGLAGPGRKISGIMPCTVIRPGDMADRILDSSIHPEWNGERCRLVYSFPTNEALWNKYAEIREESLKAGKGIDEATEFYRSNQKAMDEGARVAWPERFNPDEISALQYAMNLKLQDEASFFAEYQNDPLPLVRTDDVELTAEAIAERLHGLGREVVPITANRVTAFIDVQMSSLFYNVAAWEDDFTGYAIDYGTFPDQARAYFTLRDLKSTLAKRFPGAGLEGQIFQGLEALVEDLAGREWKRDGGGTLQLERILIDANWGQSTDVVYKFCRQSRFSHILMPSHGRFVGASSLPLCDRKKKPGERFGLHWIIPVPAKRSIRHVIFDSNYWKSFLHARLAVARGDRGSLTLFGEKKSVHRMLSEHLTAEYRVRVAGRGRECDEWKLRPERPDNHFFDGMVGCAVAASIGGCVLPEIGGTMAGKKNRKSFAEMQRAAKARVQTPGPEEPEPFDPPQIEPSAEAPPEPGNSASPSPQPSPRRKRVSFAEMQRKARTSR